MSFGFSLVFFLSIMERFVIGHTKNAECGETTNFIFPCRKLECDLKFNITNVTLIKDDLMLWTTDQQPSCSQKTKYCFKTTKDGNLNLTVHSPSFEDKGAYKLYTQTSSFQPDIINLHVQGVCQPELSSRGDELTCEVKTNSTYKPTITWRINGKNITTGQDLKNETIIEVRSSINLTEQTKKGQLCCVVTYKKHDIQQEIQNCANHQDSPVAKKNDQNDKQEKDYILPITCLLVIAVVVASYITYQCRKHCMHRTHQKRERTFSGVNLLGSEDENTEASVQPQGSQEGLWVILKKISCQICGLGLPYNTAGPL